MKLTIQNKRDAWLKEFVELGLGLVGTHEYSREVKLVTKINRSDKPNLFHGKIFLYPDNTAKIVLMLNYRMFIKEGSKVELVDRPFSKIDILCTTAHELAHLKYFDHCPNHKILESEIVSSFMARLKKLGYLSEEVELSKLI
jgi:hypothetical protein